MNSLDNWIVSIVGGIIPSIIGGLILSAKRPAMPQNAEGCLLRLFLLAVFGLMMTIETFVAILLNGILLGRATGMAILPSPVAEIVVGFAWLAAATFTMGVIFFGWRLPE
jgi:hypothetical protein